MLVKWLKQHWKKMLFFLFVFIVLVPFLINILFKMDLPFDIFVIEWDASAALESYFTLLGAGLAVFGVYLTIQYSRENYKEDVRNRVLPFVMIEMLKTQSHINIFSPNNTEDKPILDGYKEYKVQDVYCILNDGEIEYKTSLTKEQKQTIEQCGLKWVQHGSGYTCVNTNYICIPLEIENVGNGAAVNFIFGLNRRDVNKNERKFFRIITLKVGGEYMIHIFSEDCGIESRNLGDYVLSFVYEDIYKNKYEQDFDISLEYNDNYNTPFFSINMTHVQTLIKQEERL